MGQDGTLTSALWLRPRRRRSLRLRRVGDDTFGSGYAGDDTFGSGHVGDNISVSGRVGDDSIFVSGVAGVGNIFGFVHRNVRWRESCVWMFQFIQTPPSFIYLYRQNKY